MSLALAPAANSRRSPVPRSRGQGGGLVAPLALALLFGLPLRARADDDPWVSGDKALHFGVSAAIALAAYGASVPLLYERWERSLFAAGVGVAAGAGKELADALGSGHPSARDFAWDLLGVAVGVGVAVLVDTLVGGRRTDPEASLSPEASFSLTLAPTVGWCLRLTF
jgi:putative lipoprotein